MTARLTIEQDELAALLAAVFEATGVPYRFVIRGDGKNWVSVETVPWPDAPEARA